MEDFALRAGLIDSSRYLDEKEYADLLENGQLPERFEDIISDNIQDDHGGYHS